MSYLEALLPPDFARAFGWTLLHSLWQGAVLALVAMVILLILRRSSPKIRYAMLYAMLVLLPLMFLTTFFLVYQPQHSLTPVSQSLSTIREVPEMELAKDTAVLDVPWHTTATRAFDQNAHWIFLVWMAGFFFFAIRFSGSMLYILRLKSYKILEVDKKWQDKVAGLSASIGLRKMVRLSESALVKLPLTVGYLKPVILVPLGTLSGVPPQQIDAILLHELAHILRRDYLLNIMQSLIEVVFFYHPVTWWLSGLIRQEREHICDDLVMSVNTDCLNYIKALTTMEEMNRRTPLLATAFTGQRKKLLARIMRLAYPERLKRGFMEGIVATLLLSLMVIGAFTNAFTLNNRTASPGNSITELSVSSVFPTRFDLAGGESFERETNFLPVSFFNGDPGSSTPALSAGSVPDTIVAKSGSGRVIVKVYTDTIGSGDEKELEVFVEALEDNVADWEQAKKEYEKQVIILKKDAQRLDSTRKVIVIRSGDSLKVIRNDSVIWFPNGSDTTFVTDHGFQFYGFDMPEIPEMHDLPELEGLHHYYFSDENLHWTEDQENLMKEYEIEIREMEDAQGEMEHARIDKKVIVVPSPGAPESWEWVEAPEMPEFKNSERIIRQELKEDGLTMRGKKYIVELDSKAMYINGEKQPKEVYRKYRKLVESLQSMILEGNESFKMIF